MTGVVALHGGGEFLAGDEAFLAALLGLVMPTTAPVRVAIVPTAGARGRPDLAGAHGIAAFRRAGVAAGRSISAEAVEVLDAASADDPVLAARLAAADVIHLPGGDPDIIPSLYPASAVWVAIREAHDHGAVLAGASAGAMALASLTWTPGGIVRGLGLVEGCLVVPHADAGSWDGILERWGALRPPDTAILGIAERTGVLVAPDGPWHVVGEGEARWLAPGAATAVVVGPGGRIER